MKRKCFLIFTGIFVIFLSLVLSCTTQSNSPNTTTTSQSSIPAYTTQSNSPETITTSQSNTIGPGTIQMLLNLMPTSVMQDDRADITINDYAKMRQLFGIHAPASSSREDMEDYIISLSKVNTGIGQSGFISGMDQYAVNGNIKSENVGFGAPNVDAEIYTGVPPTLCDVLSGSFNPSTTKDVFSKQNGWPKSAIDKFSSEVYKEVTIYSWGDGNVQDMTGRFKPPDFDNLGRARPLAVTKNNVFYSNSVANIKLMIDVASDRSLALTSLPQYAAIADGLTELNVYSAYIAKETMMQHGMKDTSQSPLLKKYLACATGAGKDEKGDYMVILLAHEDSKTADENAKILETRINSVSTSVSSEGATPVNQLFSTRITSAHVYSKGNLVLAKLYTQNPRLWTTFCYGVYPLLLDE
jgi:hypothetical protein